MRLLARDLEGRSGELHPPKRLLKLLHRRFVVHPNVSLNLQSVLLNAYVP